MVVLITRNITSTPHASVRFRVAKHAIVLFASFELTVATPIFRADVFIFAEESIVSRTGYYFIMIITIYDMS